MRKTLILLAAVASGTFYSCQRANESGSVNQPQTDMNKLAVPSNFQWNTTKDIRLNITGKVQGNVVNAKKITVYDKHPNSGGQPLVVGGIDDNGAFNSLVRISAGTKELFVKSNFPGLTPLGRLVLTPGKTNYDISLTIGEIEMVNLDIIPSSQRTSTNSNCYSSFQRFGTWDKKGRPNYSMTTETISNQLLADIASVLPENESLPDGDNNTLIQSTPTDLKLLRASNSVKVTFLSEGAAYKNVLGFYTYPLSSPPTSVSQITNAKIIFPNVSDGDNGDPLDAGNTVTVATNVPANTGIGYFIVANGFVDDKEIKCDPIYYSNPSFNPETDPNKRRHMVMLQVPNNNKVVLGFEDINREWASCDNDFNDALFYVSVDPANAIDPDIPDLPTCTDSDNDRVCDKDDAYPNDPTRAYNCIAEGTLAYEDLWPAKGDFDFNDMVIEYNCNHILNGQNKCVEIISTYALMASGAGFENGFGVQYGSVPASQVASFTGAQIPGNSYITRNANGTEAGVNEATVILWESQRSPGMELASYSGTSRQFFNTEMIDPKNQVKSVTCTTKFVSPVLMSDLGGAPFNPFIIVDKNRGREVHLPGFAPTSKATPSLFKTIDDNSTVGSANTYKTSNNLPWAINIPTRFNYPVEKVDINAAHLRFSQWAQSGGEQFTDWYLNLTGYRNPANIYSK